MSRPAISIVPSVGESFADQDLDQGRLAATGGADEKDELAAIDCEIETRSSAMCPPG